MDTNREMEVTFVRFYTVDIFYNIFVPNSRGVHGWVHMEEPNQIAVNKFSSLITNLNQFKNILETSEPVLNRFSSNSEVA